MNVPYPSHLGRVRSLCSIRYPMEKVDGTFMAMLTSYPLHEGDVAFYDAVHGRWFDTVIAREVYTEFVHAVAAAFKDAPAESRLIAPFTSFQHFKSNPASAIQLMYSWVSMMYVLDPYRTFQVIERVYSLTRNLASEAEDSDFSEGEDDFGDDLGPWVVPEKEECYPEVMTYAEYKAF